MIVIGVLVLAVVTRLALLNLRPLHHDEGVNYYFASQILQTGRFMYDPTNYHGPLYFFTLVVSFLALGVSEFSLRLPAALFGIATVSVVWFFWSRRAVSLSASLLLLVSSSLLYYSRYSIHEAALVFFSLLAVLLLVEILERQDLVLLPYFAATVALMLTTKETAVMMVAVLTIISLLHVRRLWSALTKPGAGESLLLSFFIFALLFTALYSSFFIYPKGLADAFRGLMPWVSRGVEGGGHTKQFLYYLTLIARWELPLALFGLAGLWYAWRSVFGRSIAVWFLVTTIAYSAIEYKTPWLIINVVTPLCVLAAIGYRGLPWVGLKRTVFIGGLVSLGVSAFYLNFVNPWRVGNPYAYEHTDADIVQLVSRVKAQANGNPKILVVADEYWPLPFYFHGKYVEYLAADVVPDALTRDRFDVFVVQDRGFRLWDRGIASRAEAFWLRPGVTLLYVEPKRVAASAEPSVIR